MAKTKEMKTMVKVEFTEAEAKKVSAAVYALITGDNQYLHDAQQRIKNATKRGEDINSVEVKVAARLVDYYSTELDLLMSAIKRLDAATKEAEGKLFGEV